jgi:integrase
MGRPSKGWQLRPPRPGREHYTVRFTDSASVPREYTTGESDPVKAARRAADIYARSLVSKPAERGRISPHRPLDEQMSKWLASLETTHDEETVATYTSYAVRFVSFFENSISNITVARMGDYQRARLGEVVVKTLRKERSALNGFLFWCEEQGVIRAEHLPRWPRLPSKATGTRSGPQREVPVDVTPAQVNAFIAALPKWSRPRAGVSFAIRARFVVAYETGLRPALLDELAVPKHWRPGSTEIVVEKQHDKARFGRKVPISPRCAVALEETVAALGLEEGLIFGEHDYRWAVDRAAAAVGLPPEFAQYDLRHARAGHLLDAGAKLRAVAHLLGHRKLTTTDRYLRAQESDAREALEVADIRDQSGTEVTSPVESEDALEFPNDVSAKEGGRTPTAFRPLEPESGGTHMVAHSYENRAGQKHAESDTSGQGFGDVPETIPRAAHFLSLLRAEWDTLDGFVAAELLGEDE